MRVSEKNNGKLLTTRSTRQIGDWTWLFLSASLERRTAQPLLEMLVNVHTIFGSSSMLMLTWKMCRSWMVDKYLFFISNLIHFIVLWMTHIFIFFKWWAIFFSMTKTDFFSSLLVTYGRQNVVFESKRIFC